MTFSARFIHHRYNTLQSRWFTTEPGPLSHTCRSNSYNVFDFVVVIITTLSLFPQIDMRVISTLRLLRAFRVMRIFARLGSARKLITALSSSMIPVCNVLIVVLGMPSTDLFARKITREFAHVHARASPGERQDRDLQFLCRHHVRVCHVRRDSVSRVIPILFLLCSSLHHVPDNVPRRMGFAC